MKIKELMIGDWVALYGTPTRWERADYEKWHKEMERTDIHTFEPIPLTSKMLESNGFVSYGESWYIPADDWGTHIRIGFHLRETEIDIYKRDGFSFQKVYEPGKLYVHELQHALRLCGKDLNITI